jgi:hypothetical protein
LNYLYYVFNLHNWIVEGSTTCMNSIIKNLEQLLANKSTIETILEQTDGLVGLPIPYEHHEYRIT